MTTQHETHIPEWTIGDRLRKAREAAGYSQAELAVRIGVARNTVGNAETGARNTLEVVLKAWAEVTDVPLGWILTGETSPLPPSGQPVNPVNFSDTELMQYRYQSGTIVPDEGTPFPTAA